MSMNMGILLPHLDILRPLDYCTFFKRINKPFFVFF